MRTKDIGMEVAADPKLLASVRGVIRCYVAGFGFESDRIDEVVLAVDEACTNAIRHAYGGPCDQSYEVNMRSNEHWLEIEIRDCGRPAAKEVVNDVKKAPPNDVDEVSPGGLGLSLMQGVFDHVEFQPGDSVGNCVTMRLNLPKTAKEDR